MITRLHLCALALLVSACGGGSYKHPTLSSAPSAMSAETLCFRYANNKKDEVLAREVQLRGLDCFTLLEDDPFYHDPSIGMGLR